MLNPGRIYFRLPNESPWQTDIFSLSSQVSDFFLYSDPVCNCESLFFLFLPFNSENPICNIYRQKHVFT